MRAIEAILKSAKNMGGSNPLKSDGSYNPLYALSTDQVTALAIHNVSKATHQSMEQVAKEVYITDISKGRDDEITAETISELYGDAISNAAKHCQEQNKPSFIVIAENKFFGHLVLVALIPNIEGKISVEYINSTKSEDGLDIAQHIHGYLKNDKTIELENNEVVQRFTDQQYANSCGLVVADNIAKIALKQPLQLFADKSITKKAYYEPMATEFFEFINTLLTPAERAKSALDVMFQRLKAAVDGHRIPAIDVEDFKEVQKLLSDIPAADYAKFKFYKNVLNDIANYYKQSNTAIPQGIADCLAMLGANEPEVVVKTPVEEITAVAVLPEVIKADIQLDNAVVDSTPIINQSVPVAQKDANVPEAVEETKNFFSIMLNIIGNAFAGVRDRVIQMMNYLLGHMARNQAQENAVDCKPLLENLLQNKFDNNLQTLLGSITNDIATNYDLVGNTMLNNAYKQLMAEKVKNTVTIEAISVIVQQVVNANEDFRERLVKEAKVNDTIER